MNDPSLKNRSEEYFSAYLIKAGKDKMERQAFKYSKVTDRSYSVQSSVMPLEYVGVSESIKTTDLSLEYASGDKVEIEGRALTIRAVQLIHNLAKAAMGFRSVSAAVITLEGGAQCE